MSVMNVLERLKYIGFVKTTRDPRNDIAGPAFASLKSPYVARIPIRPRVKVDNLSAENVKPNGRQNSAPQKTWAIKGMLTQPVNCKFPFSTR
jgi:hypothetical protein